MKNRELIWITVVAITVAGMTIHFFALNRSATSQNSNIVSKSLGLAPRFASAVKSKTWDTQANSAQPALTHLRDLFAQDSSDQSGHAAELLNQTCRDHQFQTALSLMDAVPRDLRSDWLKIIFNRWAQSQPTNAMQALEKIGDADERAGALRAAVAGWNSSDPAGLANYAINQPASDDRDYALTSALENWSLQDPAALAAWLNTLPRGAEFDYGAALMIAKTDRANRSPELAMKWVESIADPDLKQTSFTRVIAEWLQIDSTAAKQYAATATWLDDSARSKILNATAQ
jgi:hypothetical protein